MDVQISAWIDAPELQPAGREYAIGDVHGFSDKLEAVLQAMGENAAKAGQGHFTFLGDLIDKGPDPAGALRLATIAPECWGFSGKTLVVGNHDLFLLLVLKEDEGPRTDFFRILSANGFLDTARQLGAKDVLELRPPLIDLLGEAGLAEIEGMQACRRSGNVTMSHAGPGWVYGIHAAEWYARPVLFDGFVYGYQDHYTWTRFWWTREAIDDGIFVHGHTPERIIRGERQWHQDLHRIDGPRLGIDGQGWEKDERYVVGAEMEPGRYRIYSA